ncbi:MAG: hypothetical protein SRB2_03297 [Desulfobacteraceae bacterium Eth-SRB2]|nr:MAG: hypothetical protein SRB2_03297 [Desulfobacteraceae bacterium Eth-SRB2]
MVSCRGKPLSPEIKKLTVSAKQYFDRNRRHRRASVKRRYSDAQQSEARYDAVDTGIDKSLKLRGRPIYAVSVSYPESSVIYSRLQTKRAYSSAVIKSTEEEYPDQTFNKATC